ncbi:MAG: pyridoxamine 5-phosphate oxidase [Clostridia bacterium]|jgi:uncharacterized pyridoxamine 5'-phosphate oxidase family protein|nr:pyridoxamine 5-phosphate oxidase [Clostridia bacterium]
MERILKFLRENNSGALATVDNGKPRVRPWGFMMEEDGKFYFCTANTKDAYKQLQQNPYIEFMATSSAMVTVRLSGKVTFTQDSVIKNKVLEQYEMVKKLYQSADNPIFEVFYIEHGEAILSDFSGNPPTVVNF